MSALRLFQITLVLVLWYFLAGLVFSRWLQLWPAGFEREGFFLVSAALPWSLLTLEFYQPTDSLMGAAVRDILFLLVLAFGIAANVAIAMLALKALARRLALEHAIVRQLRALGPPRTDGQAAAPGDTRGQGRGRPGARPLSRSRR